MKDDVIGTGGWDEFCYWLGRFDEWSNERLMHDYKLDIGRQMVAVRETVESGRPGFAEQLKVAIRGHYGVQWPRVFSKWAKDETSKAKSALLNLWDEDNPLDERIDIFCDVTADEIKGIPRSWITLTAVLLGACGAENYPLFNAQILTQTYRRVGFESIAPNLVGQRYVHCLSFYDTLIEECKKRDLKISNRLYAQTLTRLIGYHKAYKEEWPEDYPQWAEEDRHNLLAFTTGKNPPAITVEKPRKNMPEVTNPLMEANITREDKYTRDDAIGAGGWDEFCYWLRRFDEWSGEEQMHDYKLEAGRQIAAARETLESGESGFADQLDAAIDETHDVVQWSQRKPFTAWMNSETDGVKNALAYLWDETNPLDKRIDVFTDVLADEIDGKSGKWITLMSVLLGACGTEDHPYFNAQILTQTYKRVGFDTIDLYPVGRRYEHCLFFYDTLIEECGKRNLEISNRLYAQSLTWLIGVYNYYKEKWPWWYPQWPEEDRRNLLAYATNKNPQVSADESPLEDRSDVVTPLKEANTLARLASDLHITKEFLEEIVGLLLDRRQVIFQGPPGTGKTYIAGLLGEYLVGDDGLLETVQFHPSYSYEDFVEGFRPAVVGGRPGFELEDGPLKSLAILAREHPDETFVLIIDEINRGNLAKILGELYFLLEYRDKEMTLQYSKDPFGLPKNLLIIGTMNTADRSIALVDSALRRRFYFMDFYPDEEPISEVLRKWLASAHPELGWLAAVINKANELIADRADRHRTIGPSYFISKGEQLNNRWVERIWKHSIIPYVTEQFFGAEETIQDFSLVNLRAAITGEVDEVAADKDG